MIDFRQPFIIADIGSNWKRHPKDYDNIDLAIYQIHEAAHCGVDAVKFQLFSHEELYGYPGPNDYTLPVEWLYGLKRACQDHGVQFMCTAFSVEGIHKVDPFVNIHKLASCENQHREMLLALLKIKKPTLISLGASNEPLLHDPSFFYPYFYFLECVAAYPAPIEDYNLSTLNNDFLTKIKSQGISDHTLGNEVALIAVGKGAYLFEKHFDGFPELPPTPDSPHSLGPDQMKDYVESIHRAFKICESRPKKIADSEKDIITTYKRRVIATQPIKKGDLLVWGKNIGFYRAKKPQKYLDLAISAYDGAIVKSDLEQGQAIHPNLIESHVCAT